MSFLDNIKSALDNEFNYSQTENGALGYRTTGKELLDINFRISSFRALPDEEVAKQFAAAYYENKVLAVLWLFYVGDVRGGVGERRLFKICFQFLAKVEPKLAEELLPLIPEYTRWDVLLPLLDSSLKDSVITLLDKQLQKDEQALLANKPVSLCAKWMPSINTTSEKSRAYAKILAEAWGISSKQYRKRLASLREYLKITEVYMSRGDWGLIDYEQVPSRANLIYGNAFLRNDTERREAYINALAKGEAKINASVLFPHDIVHKYARDFNYFSYNVGQDSVKKDDVIEALWKGLPDYVKGKGNVICVCDTSASMSIPVGNTSITAYDVAMSLSIYFAERSSGIYKDKFITFSEHPRLLDLSKANSLIDKLGIILAQREVANTNIEGVFNLILTAAIKGKSKQEDLPETVLILSDMEFDQCASFGDLLADRLFEVIGDRFKEHGYKLPRLVFWNIDSRSMTIPLRENKLGVALVSGFSPQVVEMVLSSELDPFKCLLQQLTKERYLPVYEIIRGKLN